MDSASPTNNKNHQTKNPIPRSTPPKTKKEQHLDLNNNPATSTTPPKTKKEQHSAPSNSVAHSVFPVISKKQYRETKKTLIRIEQYNNHHIYIIYCQGKAGWCEAAEHSALFFYYEVARRLGSNHRLFTDTTTSTPYSIGYVRFSSPEAAIELVKRAGIYHSEGRDNHGLFYIELKKPFDNSEVQTLIKKDCERRLEDNTITPAANLAPDFYQLLINTGRRLFSICNNELMRSARSTSGQIIPELIHDSISLYHHIVNAKPHQTQQVATSWLTITTHLSNLRIELKVLCDLRLVAHPENLVEIIDSIRRLETYAYREYRRNKKSPTKDHETT